MRPVPSREDAPGGSQPLQASTNLSRVRVGDAIWNPLSGERAVTIVGSEDTGGEYLEVEFALGPEGFLPGGPHYHDEQSETFRVLEGSFGVRVEGRESVLGPGETTTVAAGELHEWWNAGEDEIRAHVRVEPALDFELMIATVWGLCADGLTDERGNPDPLRGALIAQRFSREYRVAKPPRAVQRALFPPLAAIARLRGLDAMFERYSDIERHPCAVAGLGYLPPAGGPRTSSV